MPDGHIASTPFDCLATDDGKFLIDQFEIHYLQSFSDLLEDRYVRLGGPSVVVGDPDYDMPIATNGDETDLLSSKDSYERLPRSMLEAQTVATLLSVAPLIGEDATKANLLDVQGPEVLHLATHGVFGEKGSAAASDSAIDWSPSLSNPLRRVGLAMAGANNRNQRAGILSGEDVLSMDLAGTDLVVLSACRSATGDIRIGEGVLGLARAFAVAGAANVIMSAWDAADDETCELMTLFYTARQSGLLHHAGNQPVTGVSCDFDP